MFLCKDSVGVVALNVVQQRAVTCRVDSYDGPAVVPLVFANTVDAS